MKNKIEVNELLGIGLKINAYCHLFGNEGNEIKSLCGIPRREQQRHWAWNDKGSIPNFCSFCELIPCEKCIILALS